MQDLLGRMGLQINVGYSFIVFTLIWVRVLAMTATVPFLFSKPVPRVVSTAASIALAMFAFPHFMPATTAAFEGNVMFVIVLYLKEAFYGFLLGFSVSILFHAFEAVGQMVDNQRGVSIARILIPQLGEQGSISGLFLFQFALVIYLSMGGHLTFFDAFFTSFKELPILEFPTAGPGMFSVVDLIAQLSSKIFYISMQLAGPVIIAILLVDIIMAVANRIAPQINVWELSFNVKGYIGILLLFVSLTMIGKQVYKYTEMANGSLSQAVWYLKGHEKLPDAEEAGDEEGLPKPEKGPLPVETR